MTHGAETHEGQSQLAKHAEEDKRHRHFWVKNRQDRNEEG